MEALWGHGPCVSSWVCDGLTLSLGGSSEELLGLATAHLIPAQGIQNQEVLVGDLVFSSGALCFSFCDSVCVAAAEARGTRGKVGLTPVTCHAATPGSPQTSRCLAAPVPACS